MGKYNEEETILEVKDLNVKFDNNYVLKNVSFYVKKGEILVIMGPNGSGKTTLLKAILGTIPYEGEIILRAKNIAFLPSQDILKINNLIPLTVNEFFNLKTKSMKIILNMLKDVGLKKNILERQISKLSTGEFQRMIIAWSMINHPTLLLFDEPTSGIDIGGKETIYSLLHRFWKRFNMTILLITHDLSIVYEHATKVLCLNNRVCCYGEPKKAITPKTLAKLYGEKIKFYKHNH